MRHSIATETPGYGDVDRPRQEAAVSRRLLLRRAALAAGTLMAALLAACDKPYFDRDRGVFVFSRHDK
jgi:hypothetical protein